MKARLEELVSMRRQLINMHTMRYLAFLFPFSIEWLYINPCCIRLNTAYKNCDFTGSQKHHILYLKKILYHYVFLLAQYKNAIKSSVLSYLSTLNFMSMYVL